MRQNSVLEAWVARDENGMLYLYLEKPRKYQSNYGDSEHLHEQSKVYKKII